MTDEELKRRKEMAQKIIDQKVQKPEPKPEPSLYYRLAVGGYLGPRARDTAKEEGDVGMLGRLKKEFLGK